MNIGNCPGALDQLVRWVFEKQHFLQAAAIHILGHLAMSDQIRTKIANHPDVLEHLAALLSKAMTLILRFV